MNIEMIPLISFVFVTTFTPGPNNISSASMGVMCGYRKTVFFLVGIASGFFVVMLIAAYLSGTLLKILPDAERYLRWVGSGYILWLALGVLRSDFALENNGKAARSFAKGFFLQLFNPKVAVFGLTLYSTFLAPLAGRPTYLFFSAVTFALTAYAATSTWTLFGATIKLKLKHAVIRKALNASFSLLLVYTAADLSGILG
jgi:cysteine/O-acetylserine efflux protein